MYIHGTINVKNYLQAPFLEDIVGGGSSLHHYTPTLRTLGFTWEISNWTMK